MTSTVSDAVAAANAAAMPGGNPDSALESPRLYTGIRARGNPVYRSLSVATTAAATMWADLTSSWWTPVDLPPLRRAWARRFPDRSRVRGNSALLYRAWVLYGHTIGLAVPAAVAAVVGVVAAVAWVLVHPARLALGVVMAGPFVAVVAGWGARLVEGTVAAAGVVAVLTLLRHLPAKTTPAPVPVPVQPARQPQQNGTQKTATPTENVAR